MYKNVQAETKTKIVELVRKGSTITSACKKVEIHRDTFYAWQQTDPDFAAAIALVKQARLEETDEAAEFHMHKWVREGHQKSVYKWLDARHPSFRRDAYTLVMKDTESGEDGVPFDLSKEQFFQLMRAAELNGRSEMYPDISPKLRKEYLAWRKRTDPRMHRRPKSASNPTQSPEDDRE